MFKKGDVFQGNQKYYGAGIDGKLISGKDRTRIKIIDVKSNIFTAEFLFQYDPDQEIFLGSITGIGIYNKRKNTFKIIESLFELPLTLENKNTIEVTIVKGCHSENTINFNLLEALHAPDTLNNVLYAAKAVLKKIN